MVIDILFFSIAAYGFVLGYKKGVIGLILTSFSLFVGFLLAVQFTPNMHELLKEFFKMESVIMPALAFVLSYILSLFFLRILAQFAETFLKEAKLGAVNQLAGGLLIGFFGLFLYSGIIWFLSVADVLNVISPAEALELESEGQYISKTRISRTYPYINLFLEQFDIFVEKSTIMINELWREITILWEQQKSTAE